MAIATVTNTSSFTPAQQAAFNSAAAFSGGKATSTTNPAQAVNAPIPTAAPTGQTSVSSPTPVMSSQPAVQAMAGMQSTTNQALKDMSIAQANKQAAAANPPPPPPAPVKSTTPAEDALKAMQDTPETGHLHAWNGQGSRIESPIGAPLPEGYSLTNPNAPKVAPTTPELASATDSVGNVYKKYSDGTYGKFDPTGVYTGPAQSQDFTTAQHGQAIFDSLNSALNGTYPLSASQQSQVDGLKAQFQQLIKSQETANANYTGGMTVAQNLYGMGNSMTGLGEIKSTVDAGISKIADLNSKMSTAVSQMEQMFQDGNIKNLQSTYGLYTQAVKERQDELDKIQAATQKAIVDQRNDARQQEQMRLTALMDDHTIDYQTKQNEMAQTTLSDKEKQQIVDNQHTKLIDALDEKKFDLQKKDADRNYNLALRKERNAEQATANAAAINNAFSSLPSVAYTPSGRPDAKAQQDFLNALPGGPEGLLAIKVKGLANYTMKPTDFAVSGKKGVAQYTRDNLIALATKFDPRYDDNKFDTRHDTLTDYDPKGKSGKTIASLNMAMQHLADISDSSAALHNGNFTTYNAVANAVSSRLGSGSQAAAQANMAASIGELATVFKGTPGTDQEIKNLEVLTTSSSPDQVKAVVAEELKLVGARLNTLNDTYVSAMGKVPDTPLIKPTTSSALTKLSKNGYSIDVPGFDAEATTALDSIVGANATSSSPLDSIGTGFGIH